MAHHQEPALQVLLRRPTLKTGRGFGKKKKVKASGGLGFKLLEAFKSESYDINQPYVPDNH